MGCGPLIADRVEIIKTSLESVPHETEGIVYVATNQKIKVAVEGIPKSLSEMDIGGKYILGKGELTLLVKKSKKLDMISGLKGLSPEVMEILSK